MSPTLEAQRRRTKIALVIAGVAVFLSLTAAGLALVQRFQDTTARRNEQTRINASVCAAAASDRRSIRQLVIQSDRLLGKPGTPGFVYYSKHPDELRAAHAQSRENLKKFLPVIRCSPSGKAYRPGIKQEVKP